MTMADERHALALLLGLALIFASCGCVQREAVEKGLGSARDIVAKAEPLFVAAKQSEEQACGQDAACVDRVRVEWARVADALDTFHAAWCALAPTNEGCE